jgi:hypothetical protein
MHNPGAVEDPHREIFGDPAHIQDRADFRIRQIHAHLGIDQANK